MKNTIRLTLVAALLQTAGCSLTTIGEEDSPCAGKPLGSLCKGPMEVYELTNTHDNLEHLMQTREQIENQAENSSKNRNQPQPSNDEINTNYIYNARSETRQYPDNYEKATVSAVALGGDSTPTHDLDQHLEINRLRQYNQTPTDIAPEPLAVLEEAEAMRIYVTSWEDRSGDLNMPGYIFVELKPKRWVAGRHANMRPSRIVPFQMMSRSKTSVKRKKQFSKGVDALNIERPLAEKNK